MSTLILTGYDDKMKELGDLTAPRMAAYAERHGFDFLCVRDYPAGVPAYWQKMHDVVHAFDKGYTRVIWLDADQIVTNPEFVPGHTVGFHASLDWGQDATEDSHFSMCAFVACPDSRYLFEWVLAHRDEYLYGAFPEQTPMRHLYASSAENRRVMTIHPRCVFNAVPIEVHPTVVSPWHPGCWLCHLTMVPLPERVRLFHLISGRL